MGVGIGFDPGGGPATLQQVLGDKLLALWDAEDAASIALSGAAVSGWTDLAGGHVAAQPSGTARPLYSATGFNGRPGISFDGVDDALTLASIPFAAGSVPIELWGCIDQAPAIDGLAFVLTCGGAGTGASLGALDDGEGPRFFAYATDLAVNGGDAGGRHVLRAAFGSSSIHADIDGAAGTEVPALPAPASGPLRIGADAETVAGAFFTGVVNALLVTAPLAPGQAAQLTAMLMVRAGIA